MTQVGRIVVLGAGMAGLLAARAAAEHAADVIIVDRDRCQEDESVDAWGNRRGVPQGRHQHAVLARGMRELESLLPGLTEELVADGAQVGDMLGDTRVCLGGHRLARGRADLPVIGVSRPHLERAVRRRVLGHPRARLCGGQDVVGLLADPTDGQVRGVRVSARDGDGSVAEMDADRVIDASGRGSRTGAWLEELGYVIPAAESLTVDVAYASRRFRLPEGVLTGDVAALCGPRPGLTRGGSLALLEDGTWLLTLIGVLGDHPPTDDRGFLRFARSLDIPDLHDAVASGEPLDEPSVYHHRRSVHRHYERMRRFPAGLTIVGDAGCALNPIYGQGMTVAALQAQVLRQRIDAPRRQLGRPADVAWTLSRGADVAFPEVEARRDPVTRLLGSYMTRLQAGATTDPSLGAAFLRVTSLVEPPQSLMSPGVARKVLRAA